MDIDCMCFNLRKAARAASRAYDDALAPVGLSNTQFSLLAILQSLGALAVSDIAKVAGMERTTLTRNLGPLQRMGLIVSEAGEDRRVRVISLTAPGRRKFELGLPIWRQAQKRMLEHLGTARGERLLKDLRFAASLGA